MRATLFALLSFLSFSCGAEFKDGNTLYAQLVDFARDQSNNVVGASHGFGYVIGVVDALNGVRHPSTKLCFSIPDGVRARQLTDTVRMYLENNPQMRHYSANSLVATALSIAFPCR